MARGTHPLRLLYRRLLGLPDAGGRVYDEGEMRALAEFLCAYADEAGGKGAPEAMTLVGLLAVDAGRERLVRWLLYPGGRDNPFLDERDRAVIEEFRAYAERVRAGEADGLGPGGAVSKATYLARRGLDDVDAFTKRAYRFFAAARQDPRAPDIIRTLPVFVPLGLDRALEGSTPRPLGWKVAATAAVVAAILAALVVALRRPPAAPWLGDGAAFAVDLEGAAVVIGGLDGRWQIVSPAGAVRYDAPRALWLPGWIDGGAAGDLTGDGVAELAIFRSAPWEAMEREATGVWVFTRAGAGWRLHAIVPLQPGTPDRARCLADLARAETMDRATLVEARRRCPQRVSAIEIHRGRLWIYQAHYGRQVLTARCAAGGCDAPAVALALDADVTGAVRLRDAAGRPALVMTTGCWSNDGLGARRAYGLSVVADDGDGADHFLPLGGRAAITAIDARRAAVLIGTRCDAPSEAPRIAGPALDAFGRARQVAVIELDAGDQPVVRDVVTLPSCCSAEPSLTLVRAGGRPRLAIAHGDHDGTPTYRLSIFDLDRPLAGQSPRSTVVLGPPREGPIRLTRLAGGAGDDELLITRIGHAALRYRVGDGAPVRR